MKKHDTPLYKFKICAAATLLCGVFLTFAAGCTQKTDSTPEQSSDIDLSSLETFPLVTFTELSKFDFDTSVKEFSGSEITSSGSEITRFEITQQQQITLNEITKSDSGITTEPDVTVLKNEKTESENSFSRETMPTFEDAVIIGENTSTTIVYGFNGQ